MKTITVNGLIKSQKQELIIKTPRSACGRTMAEFRRDAKPDLSNVGFIDGDGIWRKTGIKSIDLLFVAFITKPTKIFQFKNYSIKEEPAIPEWIEEGAECFYKGIFYRITTVNSNDTIILSNNDTSCHGVKISELTKAIKIPLDGSNIIAHCGGWHLKIEGAIKQIMSIRSWGIKIGRLPKPYSYEYLAEHGTTIDGRPLHTWTPESETK